LTATKRRSPVKGKKGISPVISTIIIVAIAIAVSIAAGYWMIGITTALTRFEKLTIMELSVDVTSGGYNISVYVKNAGSAATMVDGVLFNEKLCDVSGLSPACPYAVNPCATNPSENITFYGDILTASKRTLNPGDSIRFTMFCPRGGPFKSGTNVDVALKSSGGRFYSKTALIP